MWLRTVGAEVDRNRPDHSYYFGEEATEAADPNNNEEDNVEGEAQGFDPSLDYLYESSEDNDEAVNER